MVSVNKDGSQMAKRTIESVEDDKRKEHNSGVNKREVFIITKFPSSSIQDYAILSQVMNCIACLEDLGSMGMGC